MKKIFELLSDLTTILLGLIILFLYTNLCPVTLMFTVKMPIWQLTLLTLLSVVFWLVLLISFFRVAKTRKIDFDYSLPGKYVFAGVVFLFTLINIIVLLISIYFR